MQKVASLRPPEDAWPRVDDDIEIKGSLFSGTDKICHSQRGEAPLSASKAYGPFAPKVGDKGKVLGVQTIYEDSTAETVASGIVTYET